MKYGSVRAESRRQSAGRRRKHAVDTDTLIDDDATPVNKKIHGPMADTMSYSIQFQEYVHIVIF